MKQIALSFFLLITGFAVFSGCVQSQPVVSQLPNGQLVTNNIYSVNPNVAAYQAQAAAAAPVVSAVLAATPAAPIAPFVPDLTNMGFGLVALVSGILAAWKNRQANSHAAAAAALAATVQNANLAPQALANAGANGSSAVVAQHLANAANPVQL